MTSNKMEGARIPFMLLGFVLGYWQQDYQNTIEVAGVINMTKIAKLSTMLNA